jgi:hypothetical protein
LKNVNKNIEKLLLFCVLAAVMIELGDLKGIRRQTLKRVFTMFPSIVFIILLFSCSEVQNTASFFLLKALKALKFR